MGTSLLLITLLCGSALAHPGSGIVLDRLGRIFFTDTGRGVWEIRIVKGRAELHLLANSALHWMALDPENRFSASAPNFAPNFQKITLPGSTASLLLNSDFPCAVGPNGSLYYADTRGPTRLMRQTPQGTSSVLVDNSRLSGAAVLGLVTGIAVGGDGSVYLSDIHPDGTYSVRRIRPEGTVSSLAKNFLPKVSSAHSAAAAHSTGSLIRGLAVDERGTVYVAAPTNRCLVKITPHGRENTVTTLLRAAPPWSPTGVTVGQGSVYVLEYTDTPPGHDSTDRSAWIPRVRKVGRSGAITTLATVRR